MTTPKLKCRPRWWVEFSPDRHSFDVRPESSVLMRGLRVVIGQHPAGVVPVAVCDSEAEARECVRIFRVSRERRTREGGVRGNS